MTGYGQESDRAQSHAAGFDLHLVKPLDLERVVALFEGEPTPLLREDAPPTGRTAAVISAPAS